MNIFDGPQPQDRDARQAILERIVADLQKSYGEQIIVIGLYGSMVRGSDLPFSDVELACIVQGEEIDHTEEWVYGPSKAEVNIQSPDSFRSDILDVDEMWSLWKGSYLDMKPLFGDAAFLDEMRALVLSPSADEFNDVVAGMIVGEYYEWMGKLRNARHTGNHGVLPQLAFKFVEFGALMLGIVHRHCYTTGSKMLEESLQLTSRPEGYDALCELVMAGTLSDPDLLTARIEVLWQGMGPWTRANGIDLGDQIGWPLGGD